MSCCAPPHWLYTALPPSRPSPAGAQAPHNVNLGGCRSSVVVIPELLGTSIEGLEHLKNLRPGTLNTCLSRVCVVCMRYEATC